MNSDNLPQNQLISNLPMGRSREAEMPWQKKQSVSPLENFANPQSGSSLHLFDHLSHSCFSMFLSAFQAYLRGRKKQGNRKETSKHHLDCSFLGSSLLSLLSLKNHLFRIKLDPGKVLLPIFHPISSVSHWYVIIFFKIIWSTFISLESSRKRTTYFIHSFIHSCVHLFVYLFNNPYKNKNDNSQY